MFDVLVVGGGAMGSSVAYHLKLAAGFSGSVTVIERDPTYGRASSALSASSIRQQFSTPLNIHLSRYGIGFLRRAPEFLGVDLGLKEPGYLFLASDAGEAVLRANHAIQKGEGCAVELLEPAALCQRFPWISTEGVALASHGTANEGWFDGPALMQAFRGKARGLGAEYIADEVVGLAPNAVTLRSGGRIEARIIVLAAGPWSGEVAATAGIALPVEPRRRSVFVFDVRESRRVRRRSPSIPRAPGSGRRAASISAARRLPPATTRRARRSKSSTRNGTTSCGLPWPRGCRRSRPPRW